MKKSGSPKALRLGLVGTGVAANDLYFTALRALRGAVDVVAVANRRVEKARAFAKRLGGAHVHASADALLADPNVEAVFLSLPIHLTAEWVLKALSANKHVVSEKPIAKDVAEARGLLRKARKYDRVWLVGENFYFTPHMARAREWMRSGALGEVRLFEVNQLDDVTTKNKYWNTSWRKTPVHAGGFVLDAGVHLANIVREGLGAPVRVERRRALFEPRLSPVDTAVALLEMPSGALGVWKSCFSVKPDRNLPLFKAYGSRANLEIHYGHSTLLPARGVPKTARSPHDGFQAELSHFRACIRGRARLDFTPESALADLELIERIAT